MKSEVFAEDIEALLGRLAGVAGARVVATEAGEIDRIFVTVSAPHDPPAIRRAITAALMSEYALPVAGWRIHVARLRAAERAPLAWTLHRLNETVEGALARITVELQAADRVARLTGAAKGSADPHARLRLAAEATLQALRPVLATEERRATVEDIITVVLAGHPVVVAAVGVSGTSAATLTGAAPVVNAGDAEAAVAATLDAIAKYDAHGGRAGGRSMKSRREELEALRSEYRRLRGPTRPADIGSERAQRVERAEPSAGAVEPANGGGAEDTSAGLSEIRPERRGGAAELRSERPGAPRRGMEDEYFRQLVDRRIPVDITCRDGYQIAGGFMLDYGTYSVMVQSAAGRELLFKHAIISIRESDDSSD
jgi:sRNA-binding regulator protein Hfq